MKRLARRLHRRFRSAKRNSGRKHTARSTRLERLEPRQMMAADGLAFAQSSVFEANTPNIIPFTVEGSAQPVAISFHVHATGGLLDPATLQIRNAADAILPAVYSSEDYSGTNDSLMIVELSAGSYQIRIGGELGTIGAFDLHAGLFGDTSGNGQVSSSEMQNVMGAMVQSQFGFTNVSAQVFKKLGIDVSKNLYRSEYDVDGNGKVEAFDQSLIEKNVGAPAIELEFLVDNVPPTITAALVGDTGRSNSDGITNNLNATINGSISDTLSINSFTASVDGSAAVAMSTLLGQNFASGGNFSISRLQLEQVAGGSLVNNGSHTLLLTGRDQQGNTSTRQVSFQFDTVAPPPPTALDLDATSDTGVDSTDNNTRLQQLLLRATAENNSIVQFFSSLVGASIAQGTTSGSAVSATTSTLAEGTHSITATATDVAGNTSNPSAALSVTIDITPATTPTLALDEASDTGTPGDHLTTLTPVIFEGTTSANATVELRRGGVSVATGTANGSGAFSFSNVTLPFGASSFQVVATDLAGNSSTSAAQSFTRNSAPVVADQSFSVNENSAAGAEVGIVAASDANLGEGDTLTYSIIAGNDAGAFTINASTGRITVANAALLNFETTPQFVLTVRVTDHGGDGSGTPGTGLSDDAAVTINLNNVNEAPVVNNQGFSVAENSANDTVVGTVESSDPDVGDTRSFAITGGNTSGAFAINAMTGEIRVANSAALDYETVPGHAFQLTVTATDAGMLSDSATVTITLTDANDRPTAAASQSFTLSVKFADGSVVGTVAAQDQDAGETLTYAITGNDAPVGVFAINANTGAISVTDADTLTLSSYTLTVQVTDSDGATLVVPVTVTLNVVQNVGPTAQDDDIVTNEDASAIDISVLANNGNGADSDPDDPIASLTISDFDATSTLGATITLQPNGVLRYDPAGVPGRNALAVGQTLVDTFTYTIEDPAGAPSTATVTVTITGLNDPPSAKNDAVATTEDDALTFDPRTNHGSGADTDPDTIDVLTVTGASATSAQGATVTVNANNTITYNPATSATLQALDEMDDPVVDTFQYTISDGHGGTSMATVSVTVSGKADPSFLAIADQEVYAGAPLIIPLNGISPNDSALTFTATSDDDELLEPIVFSTSRSLSITLEGYGEMRFYLFETLVPGITQPIIDLVESGILDNTIFHRIINGFVAQGLDPTGTGLGHPGLLDFDDQYHADLQHTGSGLLSMAKAGDDTNSSQVFITDYNLDVDPTSDLKLRRLDFNHSVFGRLTLGESIRQQIMLVDTNGSDRPLEDIVLQDIQIIEDDFNAVLMLKAPNGATGSTSVTVTVEDAEGNKYDQSFNVDVTADPYNGVPFLTEYPANATTTVNTPVDISVEVFDDEGDPITISAVAAPLETKLLFDNGGIEAGITTPGASSFAIRNSSWSGGSVATNADSELFSSGVYGYTFGATGQVTFSVPVTAVEMFFVHASGTARTATAYSATNTVVSTWNSFEATDFNDPDNFISRSFSTPVTRIEFNGGTVDNFFYRNSTTFLSASVNQTTDTVTVTPPTGFTGTMAVRIQTQQSSGTTHTVDAMDRQVIAITVTGAPLMAAEGAGGQGSGNALTGANDPLLTSAFQSALATWQTALGLAELPDVQLSVRDLGGAQLGSAATLAIADSGLPTSSIITIDDDGAGRGWHTALDQSVAADRYDLYTVLLHEVGHALGFHEAIESLGLSDAALEAYFDDFGHLLGDGDLMSEELSLGQRRLPSALDVDILRLAYGLEVADGSALDAVFAAWN